MGTEDNNAPKEEARKHVAMMINSHFGDRLISMVELLGAGVGLEYYVRNCPHLVKMVGIESSKEKIDAWKEERRDPLHEELLASNRECSVAVCHNDLYSFFNNKYQLWKLMSVPYDVYDVINLDFCSWMYLKAKTRKSPGEIIDKIFETKALRDGGLLFVTFMIDGYSMAMNANRLEMIKSVDEIQCALFGLAEKRGYSLDPIGFPGVYKSSHRTKMMYAGYVARDTGIASVA